MENGPVRIVEKPWGREIWVAHTDRYAFKVIEFNAGSRSSLQYHERKHEHIWVESGLLQVELEQPDGSMTVEQFGPGSVIENPPGRKHRVEALEDVRLFEVSTPELDDVIRVEDDYGR
jgi:mannose-6-phosphate isomerase-like protein (cupin superfamily)